VGRRKLAFLHLLHGAGPRKHRMARAGRRLTLRALITGIGGFAGSHLAKYLLEHREIDVWGLDLLEGRAAQLRPRVTLHLGDMLMDLSALKALFAGAKPDYIFHLAAQAFVPASWADPWSTLENNVRGQLNVLLAAIAMDTYPRILVVGSADEYGIVAAEELPIRETNPLRPNSPYAVSKVAQDMLGYQYYASHKLPVVRVRPFNHIGPGQSPAFVASDFAKQIAESEAGLREPVVRVGNLQARRDFSDVRDIVRGYYLAISKGVPGQVYNLGAERSYSIREVLDGFLALSAVPITVEPDPARLRPSDVPEIVADCSGFRSRTGWRAEIPLERSLRDILDYWRKQVRSNKK
jgi:GDP-4-dehydro-6-deoxy-D-mannose reductase